MIFEVPRRPSVVIITRWSFPVRISGAPAISHHALPGVVEVRVLSDVLSARGLGAPLAG